MALKSSVDKFGKRYLTVDELITLGALSKDGGWAWLDFIEGKIDELCEVVVDDAIVEIDNALLIAERCNLALVADVEWIVWSFNDCFLTLFSKR